VETQKGSAKAAGHQRPRKSEQRQQHDALALSPVLLLWLSGGSRGGLHTIYKRFAQCFTYFSPFYFGHGTSDKAVFVGKTSRGTPVDQRRQCL